MADASPRIMRGLSHGGEGCRIGRMGAAAALPSDAFHPCYIRYFRGKIATE